MTSESDKAAEIARIALQYRDLMLEGAMWSGGPVGAESIKQVADAVSQSMDAGTMLRGLAESKSPEATLRGLIAIAWAQGFNVGAMYADKHGGS
ncbi:hypothetical protein OG413_40165 [Streptomyces sp. NBC_01433]|jgi:hypothetical protein|uniref:hypothetical protein n=1 Tax=Streptomyces sp. NBC_01433 TaxID=2903864 RepID=UPI00224DC815|nr:hypothetical protein [Streptomyces sp. NBC_01433]MCX4681415.1 hypothetical protein [Streptomyces sp. NBC_01433]